MSISLVAKGGYARESRYEIIQHKYMGGGHPGCGGYIELLEIKNPPRGKCSIVIHEHFSHSDSCESFFAEWDTLEHAMIAYAKFAGRTDTFKRFAQMPGFLDNVICHEHTPWFYAEEYVVGDYVPPKGYLF